MISIPGPIPIFIHPFFWLLVLMIGWLNSSSIQGTAIWSFVILISVIVHELGHALTAKVFGQHSEIHLVGLGGVTRRKGGSLSRWKEFIIILNGPLAGFFLCFLSYYALQYFVQGQGFLIYGLEVAVSVNLFWTVLNLLPVLPLDGGQLLKILFEGAFGLKGLKLSFLLSIGLASAFGLFFFFVSQILMGALFFLLAFESYKGWVDLKKMTPEDSDNTLQLLLKDGIAQLQAGHLKEAYEIFNAIRRQAPKGMLYVTSTQYAARILAEQGNFKEAFNLLDPLKRRLTIEYLVLLQNIAYRIQEWEEVVKIGDLAFQQELKSEIGSEIAFLNALSYAIMGKPTQTVGWLRSAAQQGMEHIQDVIQRREFDVVRQSEPFQQWLKGQKKDS